MSRTTRHRREQQSLSLQAVRASCLFQGLRDGGPPGQAAVTDQHHHHHLSLLRGTRCARLLSIVSGLVRATVTESCLFLERASTRRFDLDGWLLLAVGTPLPLPPAGGLAGVMCCSGVERLAAAEQMHRAAIEDAARDLRRVLSALRSNGDALAQRWHLYRHGEEEVEWQRRRAREEEEEEDTRPEERGWPPAGLGEEEGVGGGGLTLMEQFNVEIAFLWAKHCLVTAQLVVLFSLAHFSPQISPAERRAWCHQAFRSLSSVCMT